MSYGTYGENKNDVAWVCCSPGGNSYVMRVNWAGKTYTGKIDDKTASFDEMIPDGAMHAVRKELWTHIQEMESRRSQVHDGVA